MNCADQKTPSRREARTWRWVLLIVSLLLLCFIYHKYFRMYHGYDPLPFSTEAWLKADGDTRGYMVEDMCRRCRLVGMTQEELLSLLGKPDRTTTVVEMHRRWAKTNTEEELTKLYGEPLAGRLFAATYSIGYLGRNRNYVGPFVFDYRLHIEFRNGIVESYNVDD